MSEQPAEQDIAPIDEVVEVLLKGHLLIEEAVNRLVERHLAHPAYLSDASLRFYQKYTLARALCKEGDEAPEWLLIHAINALRSTISHAVRSAERDKRVARVRRTCIKETPDGPAKDWLEQASEAEVVAAASARCLAFLAGLGTK